MTLSYLLILLVVKKDYVGASAKECVNFVYNECRWKGHNYKGEYAPKIVLLVRNWMTGFYPKLLVTMFAIANNIRTTDKTLLSGTSSPLP